MTSRQRWNFAVNSADVAFVTLGLSLVSRETILPILISRLTDSQIAIGLVPMVYTLFLLLPQLFVANYVERMLFKKPLLMFLGALGERLPYLLIGLTVFVLGASQPILAYILLIVFIAISALSNGICTPAWLDMIAKVVPVTKRGSFFGVGRATGALLSVGGATLIALILRKVSFPRDYGSLFIIAWVFMMLSWIGLSLTKEDPGRSAKPVLRIVDYLRGMPHILRRNHHFRRFLIAESLIHLGAMANAFFIVAASRSFVLEPGWIGVYTAVMVSSQIAAYFFWGVLGDGFGHKASIVGGAVALIASNVLALVAPSPLSYSAVFVGLGVFLSSDIVCRMSLVVEFCPPEDRPTYVGLSNTLLAPSISIAPIIGGIVSQRFGFPPLFLFAATLGASGALLMSILVRDPRKL